MNSIISHSSDAVPGHDSPFNLDDDSTYLLWRKKKLEHYPVSIDEIRVSVDHPGCLSEIEIQNIKSICNRTNAVIYSSRHQCVDKSVISLLGKQLGLNNLDENLCSDEDGISGLRVVEAGTRHNGYIPYTNKPINWHTDGYYNLPEHKIRAMVLHCVSDAASGGENAILDHEILYILMRDKEPEMVRALMESDVMTIPANIENGVTIRNEQTGPVFSVDSLSGKLHMRYTARKRSIEWKGNSATKKATAFMESLFANGCEYIFRYKLKPGEGIICNNVLHNRTGFEDSDQLDKHRFIYRARYFDRIQFT